MYKNKFKHKEKAINDEFEHVQKNLTSMNSKLGQLNQVRKVTKHPDLSEMVEGVFYLSDNKISIKVNGIERVITFT